MTKSIKILLIFVITLLPNLAFATSIGIGTNMFYAKINDPDLRFAKELENVRDPINAIRNVNLSLSNNYGRFIYGVASNRLLNAPANRVVLDNQNREYQYSSKAILDSLAIGYAISKTTAISFLLGNLQLKQNLDRGNYHKRSIENAIIYGLSFSKKVDNNSLSLILLAPCQAIKAEYGIGISYSYQIKIL